jgi:hypothetical protein
MTTLNARMMWLEEERVRWKDEKKWQELRWGSRTKQERLAQEEMWCAGEVTLLKQTEQKKLKKAEEEEEVVVVVVVVEKIGDCSLSAPAQRHPAGG